MDGVKSLTNCSTAPSDAAAFADAVSAALGHEVIGVEMIGGGGNSKVYRLTFDAIPPCALKLYYRDAGDRRDRLGTELGALRFLRTGGVDNIPAPLAWDRNAGFVIAEFIEGDGIAAGDVTDDDVDAAVDFLARLDQLKTAAGADSLGPASEASFSFAAIVDNVQSRLKRLQAIPDLLGRYPQLHDYLEDQFSPAMSDIVRWCQREAAGRGWSMDEEIPRHARTLSPSDFGFHNAIRSRNGQIIFLDFEYFGWDDPAKTIVDFLLHPAMTLSPDHRRRFVDGVIGRLTEVVDLSERVKLVWPLFALKWCEIMLNEFVPGGAARRGFASGRQLDEQAVQAKQLAKAQDLLRTTLRHYEDSSYV